MYVCMHLRKKTIDFGWHKYCICMYVYKYIYIYIYIYIEGDRERKRELKKFEDG